MPEDAERCLLNLHQGRHQVCLLVNFEERPLGSRCFMFWPSSREPEP